MMIAAVVAILATWGIVAIALVGVGALVLRRFDDEYFALDAFWVGLGVSVALLEIWSFFWPVNAGAAILICCAGAAGLTENRAILWRWFGDALRTARWWTLAFAAIAVFLAWRATGPCDYYDTGLYGAAAVKWISTYPVVPGLANLHGRFGFNSSVLLCVAALSQGLWRGLGFHLFTGFVNAAMWLSILPACSRLIRRTSTSHVDWFYAILAIPTGFWAVRTSIVGTQTDEPATIICWVAAGMLFEQLDRKSAEENGRLSYSRLVAACGLFALAVAFKETTAVFALLGWCLAFGCIWSMARSAAKRSACIAGALVLSSLIVIPWLARGVILSGYPFFPVTALSFPVDWKTPTEMANWYARGSQSWGRMPDVELADTRGWAWVRPWVEQAVRNRSGFQVPLLISVCGLAIALGVRARGKNGKAYAWLWILVPALAGTVVWFIASPAARFGQFAIWTTAAVLGTWGIASLTTEARGTGMTRVILTGLVGLLIWCVISFGWRPPYERLFAAKPLEPLPKAEMVERTTLTGLTVYVPKEGNQCWDAPLLCTPYFDGTLRLRNPESLRSGFRSQARADILPRFQLRLYEQDSPDHFSMATRVKPLWPSWKIVFTRGPLRPGSPAVVKRK